MLSIYILVHGFQNSILENSSELLQLEEFWSRKRIYDIFFFQIFCRNSSFLKNEVGYRASAGLACTREWIESER